MKKECKYVTKNKPKSLIITWKIAQPHKPKTKQFYSLVNTHRGTCIRMFK